MVQNVYALSVSDLLYMLREFDPVCMLDTEVVVFGD